MEKLLLLSLTLLLSSCSGSKPAEQSIDIEKQMEQPIAGNQQNHSKTTGSKADKSLGQQAQIAIKQGIAGKVLWEAGNRMPSPDAPASSGKRGVQRTVYIYELTKSSQATSPDGIFYTSIQTNLVTQVVTDANGNFTVSLKPGRYSLFTKEEQGLYANLFDGENNIFPVEVKEEKITAVEFLINYKAIY
ncbi:carboxypeptidase-like regulatory domain-containing protein [Pontibacter sp. SGAir0037]|uniref:carboxypeptidase-like regulatory domain-containing protein n=1 Tax=Pontibacter sp. SGAir0037 TaxID=2571030 RepID=UPI0010CD2BD2|nr:carboxypeptidase-like regulatory domain-containing protein [Pontibacter sp. SGAir0037]QCR24261.1 hypothetical protein C1N53_19135 [Pontibacter sp. SGAir0037]